MTVQRDGTGSRPAQPITSYGNHEQILRILDREPRQRILDVPCGEGALSIELKAMGFDVECCDIDVELFRADGLEVQFCELNLGKIPHPDASFDQLVCVSGLHRLWNISNALSEFSRVLKPGGLFVYSIPNYAHIRRRLRFFFFGGLAQNISKNLMYQKSQDPSAHFRQALIFSQVAHAMDHCDLEIERVESSQGQTASPLYYPLAALIRVGQLFASKRTHDAFSLAKSNSPAILLGSKHFFVTARKKK